MVLITEGAYDIEGVDHVLDGNLPAQLLLHIKNL